MKIAVLIARILLGLMFVAPGLIMILHLITPKPMPGDAGIYMNVLMAHNYMTFVALLMLIAGILLLVGRFVPLALTILGPILVNILLFHVLIEGAPAHAAAGVVGTLLEVFLIYTYRRSFRGLFDAAPEPEPVKAI